MKSQPSAGRWTAAKHGPYVTTILPGENCQKVVCITANTHSELNFAAPVASFEDQANKVLLAAAPRLLAALTALEDVFAATERAEAGYRDFAVGSLQNALEQARAAISQAKGGQ